MDTITESTKESSETKWVAMATLIATIVNMAACGFAFLFYFGPNIKAETEKAASDVKKSKTPLVEVQGEIQGPREFTRMQDEPLGVHPVKISIQNKGEVPIKIGIVELRYYRGDVSDVAKIEQREVKYVVEVEEPQNQTEVSTMNTQRVPEERIRTSTTGIVDMESTKWREISNLRTTSMLANCNIALGQSRDHTFYLLMPPPVDGEFRRVTVTVNPAEGENWSPLTWYGYADPNYCFPGPISPGLQSDFTAQFPDQAM